MIKYNEKNKIFSIQTLNSSYFMGIDDDGVLRNIYYGEKINNADDTEYEIGGIADIAPPGKKFPIRQECITREKMLYAEPCIFTEFSDGTKDLQLVYKSHKIIKNENGDKLVINLKDKFYKFEVALNYITYNGLDLISKNSVITNYGEEPVKLKKMKSGTLYPTWNRPMRLTHLAGTWGEEYQKLQINLQQGKFTIDNTRGVCASHQHVPFFALDEGDATETFGKVWYGLLHWSGDFKIDFEESYDNQLSVTAGVNDFDCSIKLEKGEIFETPLFTVGFTNGGFEKMTETLYDYQYDFLLPQEKIKSDFPIIYNSWYPYLFDVNEEKCLGFIDKAKQIGVELFVIDDGWFGRRKDATDGLGDWWCDKEKFPNGLKPIADKAHKLGMKFGLWIEPEMVNKKSNLYKEHPDWILSFPNRENSERRNQLVLNLARKDVMEFAWESIDRIIQDFDLDYVKWDMNRYFSETAPFSDDLRVRYIENLYEIWRRMNEKYPHVLFENCASGGGRADYGMAPYSDRINRSDNADPVDVLKIHEGFSTYLLPRLAGGAGNIAPSPYFMNNRSVPLKYRAHLGMTGCMSVGINILESPAEELVELKKYLEEYKKIRHTIHNAYLYRLSSAFENNYTVWEYLARDKKEAVVFVFAHNMNFHELVPRIRLRGLDKNKQYRVSGEVRCVFDTRKEPVNDRIVYGDTLMNFGIRIEPTGDYYSQIIKIEEL